MNRFGKMLLCAIAIAAIGYILPVAANNDWYQKANAEEEREAKSTMKLGYTLLYVRDVDKTLRFYESAFGMTRKFYHAEGDRAYGEVETGPTTLGFVSHAQARTQGFTYTEPGLDRPAPPMYIGLVTDDVAAAYEKAVERGAIAVSPPEAKPWGETVSYVRDPDGFVVSISSGVDK